MEQLERTLTLVYFQNDDKPRQFRLSCNTKIGYQKNPVRERTYLPLPYPYLSEYQGTFTFEDGIWYYRSLSTACTTTAGGCILRAGERQPLDNRHVIRIIGPGQTPEQEGPMLTILALPGEAHQAPWETIRLDTSTTHTLKVMDATDYEKNESRQDYAELLYADGSWRLTGLHSAKVTINDQPIDGPVSLHVDDMLRIDETLFFFDGSRLIYSTFSRPGSPLSIHIDERAVRSGLKKSLLLKDIDLEIDNAQMVLLLGGSGAGKSTFVNAVIGYEKADATILSGGIDIYRQFRKVRYKIGYVPQQDLMRGEDTVGATIRNAAKLRLPTDLSEEEREQRVRDTLERFGLLPYIGEQVSKLSGGQRKRLSISLEFIADPTLFFLDEPDSGLDGVMARQLMQSLRSVADEGRIVLVITHTPDRIIDLFDQVIVLAKSETDRVGKLAYYGPPADALKFFQAGSMEEIVKLVSPVSDGGAGKAAHFIEAFECTTRLEKERRERLRSEQLRLADLQHQKESALDPAYEKILAGDPEPKEKNKKKVHHAGYIAQIRIYLGKLLRLFVYEHNWKVLPMAALMAFMVAYVVRWNMFKNMEGTKLGSFAIVCLCLWNGMFNSVLSVCRERDILKREHRSGLHILSYLSAHVIYQTMLCLLQTVISLVIFVLMGMKFPAHGVVIPNAVLDIGLSIFLATLTSDMMALMVSCLVRTTTAAMTVIPFLLMIQVMLSGIIFPLGDSLSRAESLTVTKWTMRAVSSQSYYNDLPSKALYVAIDKLNIDDDQPELKILLHTLHDKKVRQDIQKKTGEMMTEPAYASTKSNVLASWGILFLYGLVCILVGTISLAFIDKDKR